MPWWDPVFAGGFGKNVVVERGFLVVKLWWIDGESWEVDGQDSGSKNMPLFPDLFLRDSHFGNLVQPHGLEAIRASTLPLHHDGFHFPSRSAEEQQGRKKQSQRRVCNLILIMVFHNRPLVKTDTRRNSSWPGARVSIKGRIHCRRLLFSPKLSLAVTRRTIHMRT